MPKMKELYVKVAADSTLQEKFSGILKDSEKDGAEATEEKLITFAKEAGFDVDKEEMISFLRGLTENDKGELSDIELDMVAGGKSAVGVLFSIETIGLGCALYSAIDICKVLDMTVEFSIPGEKQTVRI